MQCIKCLFELPNTAKFCRSCGVRQDQAVIAGLPVLAPVPAPAPIKSNLPKFIAVGLLVALCTAGGSYWALSQKAAADLKAVQQKIEEQRRLDIEDADKRIKAAEENARKETLEKLKQEAELQANDRNAPIDWDKLNKDIVQRAFECIGLDQCLSSVLDPIVLNEEALEIVVNKLNGMNKPQRGDRKLARALNTKGLDQYKLRNFNEAIELLRKASEADPADIEILANFGHVSLQGNRAIDSRQPLLNALVLDPKRSSTWLPLGEMYAMLGKDNEALNALLIGYKYSKDQAKASAFFNEQASNAELVILRPLYQQAIKQITGD